MPVSFVCLCGKRVKAPRNMIGHGGLCPYCGRSVVIPGSVPKAELLHKERLTPIGPYNTDDEIDARLAHYPLHPADIDAIKQAIKAGASQSGKHS
jgi:hypothetical protein